MTEAPSTGGKSRWIRLVQLLILAGGVILEFLFGWQIWWLSQPMTSFWLAVALIGALGTAAGFTAITPGNTGLFFWLFFSLTLFIPFYGALGSAAISLYLRRAIGGQLVTHYADYIEAEESHVGDEVELLSQGTVDQMVRHELNVQSYMDIMRGPDRVLKKSLISKILSEWTPNAVALLKQGLKDPEYEIRSYSSTALTTIENRMNERILQFRQAVETDPEDGSLPLKLAQSYLDYASSGLLDPGSAGHYVRLGAEILDDLPPTTDEDDHWLRHLTLRAQAARLAGDDRAEEELYGQILERHSEHQETLSHLCGLFFRQKRFGQLRLACQRFLRHTDDDDHPALQAVRLWGADAEQEEVEA